VYNFSAGPSMMPVEVLESVQRNMLNWEGSGMSVMEMSHRGKEFVGIANEAEKNLRELLDVPAEYKVLFVQGGATLQFSAIPLNMLGAKGKADYLVTGQWGDKAQKECDKYGKGNVVCNTKASKYTSITKPEEWKLDAEAAYVHYCDNETVNGVEFGYTPEVGDVPLVADMSSNFMSRKIDVANMPASTQVSRRMLAQQAWLSTLSALTLQMVLKSPLCAQLTAVGRQQLMQIPCTTLQHVSQCTSWAST